MRILLTGLRPNAVRISHPNVRNGSKALVNDPPAQQLKR